ncbi:MAG: hypothetical protein GX612_05435 [Bacteroidales bacterium]|nr:hypothetical protein [Bacteroidales bacterium]
MKTKIRFWMPAILFALFSVFLTNCKEKEEEPLPEVEQLENDTSFTDTRDGNVYKKIKIGNQIWMAENLRYLPSVVGSGTGSETTPYYYVYGYNGTNVSVAKETENYKTYGVLYNWPAACTSCPEGWHLPTDADWIELETYLANNGYNYDGSEGGDRMKIAKAMASTNGWISSSEVGTPGNTDYPEYRNKSGFTALPGGYRYMTGRLYDIGNAGRWWTTNMAYSTTAWLRIIVSDYSNVFRGEDNLSLGLSVRCVKNK